MILRRIFKSLFQVLLGFVLMLICLEMALRLAHRISEHANIGNEAGGGFQARAMREFVQSRIDQQWTEYSTDKRPNPYRPPFPVFVNSGFENESRLKAIAMISPLPSHQTWTVTNFLRRSTGPDATFTVTTNSLGFRGPERNRDKSKKVYRIIVLGSYPAFGHAVNDNETYSSLLEEELNKNAKAGIRFEVWNGGRQGATAIMGLSRLETEILNYHPDAVILDYGWIEPFLATDVGSHSIPKSSEPPNLTTSMMNGLALRAFQTCTLESMKSLFICTAFRTSLLKVDPLKAEQDFKSVMLRIREILEKNRIYTLYLKQSGVVIDDKVYESLEDKPQNFIFMNLIGITQQPLTEVEIEKFWSQPNWLSEIGVTKSEVLKSEPQAMLRVDAIQLNAMAYRRIAHAIAGQFKNSKLSAF